jgi:hypothetical protein
LIEPALVGKSFMVKPSSAELHEIYRFYVKVMTKGDSHFIFGPYFLEIGCHKMSLEIYDSSDLKKLTKMFVLDPTEKALMFANPYSSRAWCTPLTNEIV